MHRVAIMALKTTDWTRESHLGRSQQRLGKIEEQGHAKDHYNDRCQAARRSRQGDVAEPCRSERRNCKIERISIVGDVIVVKFLGFVDKSRHHENENGKICDGKDHLFISLK